MSVNYAFIGMYRPSNSFDFRFIQGLAPLTNITD
jgi:hypothetical protein